jgi:hypothetical protein
LHDLRAHQPAGAGNLGEGLRLQGQGAGVEEYGFVKVLPRLRQVDVVDDGAGSARGALQALAELTGLPEFRSPGGGAVRAALAQEDFGGVRGRDALEHFLVGLDLAGHHRRLELLGPGGGNHRRIDVEPQRR